MRATTIEIFDAVSSAHGRWFYWHAKARNGEIVAQSEGYTRRFDARRGAKRAFPDAKVRYL